MGAFSQTTVLAQFTSKCTSVQIDVTTRNAGSLDRNVR